MYYWFDLTGNGTPTPLANEVVAVLDASEGNSFVGDIVKSIPDTALTKGIHSQETLRQRWDHVKRVCRRVSMVEESGSGLFTYVVSFFQSLLVLSEKLVPPPHPDQEVEPDSLDTFKILDYATYHMEQGDLEQAVRYVNQLKGMPRKVVADWLEQARLLLETSQAATVLSAHASASGLGGLNFWVNSEWSWTVLDSFLKYFPSDLCQSLKSIECMVLIQQVDINSQGHLVRLQDLHWQGCGFESPRLTTDFTMNRIGVV